MRWLLGVCSIRVLAKIMAIPIMNPLSWFMIQYKDLSNKTNLSQLSGNTTGVIKSVEDPAQHISSLPCNMSIKDYLEVSY